MNLICTISWAYDRCYGDITACINISNTTIRKSKIYFSHESPWITGISFRQVLLTPFLINYSFIKVSLMYFFFCGRYSLNSLSALLRHLVFHTSQFGLTTDGPNFHPFKQIKTRGHCFLWDILLVGTPVANRDHVHQETKVEKKANYQGKPL